MYYLSRTPNGDENETNLSNKNSVFPISELGVFEDTSIIQVPANSSSVNTTEWKWFAYQSSVREELQAVVVPRASSIHVISVVETTKMYWCVMEVPSKKPFACVCIYSPHDDLWNTASSREDGEPRNPLVAAPAIVHNWLYLSGGHMGNPSYLEEIVYLNSAERMNLDTGEWETLPPMQRIRSSAVGVSHKHKYYVVGGSEIDPYSAEIFDHNLNTWEYIKNFVPEKVDGFAMASLELNLVMLTWSGVLGVKVWVWSMMLGKWRMFQVYPDQEHRGSMKKYGARLVQVGNELWVVIGDCDTARCCHVSGASTWPIFPGPSFRPSAGCPVVAKGCFYAFSFRYRPNWRKIPVYSVQD